MQKKITTFLICIAIFILIIGAVVFGAAIYNDIFADKTYVEFFGVNGVYTEIAEEKNNTSNQNYDINISSNNENSIINDSNSNNFFYSQLSSNQKTIYDGLLKNKNNLKTGTYVINYGNAFSNLLSTENGSEELEADYQSALEAFMHDYVDLFYIDVSKMYMNIETTKKMFSVEYNVSISPAQEETYLANEFSSSEQVAKAITYVDNIKNTVISNLNGTDYENILYIHDYLVNTIEYDDTYSGIGTYNIFGALAVKKCVCEGYAKAFKYLANAAGYQCELIQGDATNSTGTTESHEWNCVKLNGTWYEVDVTWDDPIVVGDSTKLSKDIRYKYFLKGSTTFNENHFIKYQFSDEGKIFSYPTISENDY